MRLQVWSESVGIKHASRLRRRNQEVKRSCYQSDCDIFNSIASFKKTLPISTKPNPKPNPDPDLNPKIILDLNQVNTQTVLWGQPKRTFFEKNSFTLLVEWVILYLICTHCLLTYQKASRYYGKSEHGKINLQQQSCIWRPTTHSVIVVVHIIDGRVDCNYELVARQWPFEMGFLLL